MTDPVWNVEPPIPTATCQRCGALSDKTEDFAECADCGHTVCRNCQVREPGRYKAGLLCADCAEAREPRDGEVDAAFRHERDEAAKVLKEDHGPYFDCPAAFSFLVDMIMELSPGNLKDRERGIVADAIRWIPVDERPWRKVNTEPVKEIAHASRDLRD